MPWKELFRDLEKIPGGYTYSGACSYQICFPLKNGGELRFSVIDDDVDENVPKKDFYIDLYGGELSGITGPIAKTGS